MKKSNGSKFLVFSLLIVVCISGCAPTPLPISTLTSTPIQPTFTSEPSATATLEPQIDLEMGSYTFYLDSMGTLWLVSEVINKGEAPAGDIQVVASLLDDSDNVIVTGSGSLAYVEANGKYPFKIPIKNAPYNWSKEDIQIQGSLADISAPASVDFKTDTVNG